MPNPLMNAGADITLAYSAISGGPTNQPLTGAATVYAPGTAISTWTWALIEVPAGSAASLSSTSAQNPTLNNIDLVGTYRLLLTGVDDAAQASETDKLLAPSSAFVTVAVTSQFAALKKPAPTQRNWQDEYWALVDEADALRNELDTHVADNADPHQTLADTATVDVTDDPATGEILVATGPTTAEWQAASAGLVPVAAVATLGRVKLTETPFDALNPKAVTRDKLFWTAKQQGSLLASGFTPWLVQVPAAVIGVSGTPSPYSLVFYAPYSFYLEQFHCIMEDGGDTGGAYSFELHALSSTNYLNNAAGTLLGTAPLAHATGAPTRVNLSIGASVTSGTYLGVYVAAAPTTPGGGLTVQIHGYEEF
jgi:hypothetical protein